MTDQDSSTTGGASNGQSRRQFLQRSAVLTAAAWAAPGIVSVGAPAAAQTPNLCPEGQSPETITLRYEPGSCEDTAGAPGGPEGNSLEACCGDLTGNDDPVCACVTYGPGGNASTEVFALCPGDSFTVSRANGLQPNIEITVRDHPTDDDCGDGISGSCGSGCTQDPDCSDSLQYVRFHTSCSTPLFIGDRYASFVVVGGF